MTAVNTLEFSFEDFQNLEDTELNETMSFNKLTTFLRYHFSFSSEKLMWANRQVSQSYILWINLSSRKFKCANRYKRATFYTLKWLPFYNTI